VSLASRVFQLADRGSLHAPALSAVACWSVEQRGGKIFVRNKKEIRGPRKKSRIRRAVGSPRKIVIVGGGAAGFAAAESLRREQYQGSIVMLSNDDAPPVDRPNLSKDYLAGTATRRMGPAAPRQFLFRERYRSAAQGERHGNRRAFRAKSCWLTGARLRMTGCCSQLALRPIRLSIPGADLPHVRTLRSLADCRAIIERAKTARRAVVLGASFIGLEVAAALRARKIEVHVVAPEKRPMERILSAQMGDFVRALHEEHGVVFHLEGYGERYRRQAGQAESGGTLDADLVVAGVGVRPRTELAEKAGLALDRGVVVDTHLQTSAPDIFAAG